MADRAPSSWPQQFAVDDVEEMENVQPYEIPRQDDNANVQGQEQNREPNGGSIAEEWNKDGNDKSVMETTNIPPSGLPSARSENNNAADSNQAQGSVLSRHELDGQQGAAKRMRLEVPELQQEPELTGSSKAAATTAAATATTVTRTASRPSSRAGAGTITSSETTTTTRTGKMASPDLAMAGEKEDIVPYLDKDGNTKKVPLVVLHGLVVPSEDAVLHRSAVLTEDAVHDKLHAHMPLLNSDKPLQAPTINALIKMAADEHGVHFIPLSFGTFATSDEGVAKAMKLLMEEDERKPRARVYILPLFAAATATIVIGKHYTLAWYRQGEKKTHYIDGLRRNLDEGSATYKALDLWARHVSKNQELNIVHDGANFPLQTDARDSGVHVVLNARRVIYGFVPMLEWYTNENINTLSAPERSQKFLATRREFWCSIVLNIQRKISTDARASTSAQPARAVRQPGQMDHRAVLEDEDSDDEE